MNRRRCSGRLSTSAASSASVSMKPWIGSRRVSKERLPGGMARWPFRARAEKDRESSRPAPLWRRGLRIRSRKRAARSTPASAAGRRREAGRKRAARSRVAAAPRVRRSGPSAARTGAENPSTDKGNAMPASGARRRTEPAAASPAASASGTRQSAARSRRGQTGDRSPADAQDLAGEGGGDEESHTDSGRDPPARRLEFVKAGEQDEVAGGGGACREDEHQRREGGRRPPEPPGERGVEMHAEPEETGDRAGQQQGGRSQGPEASGVVCGDGCRGCALVPRMPPRPARRPGRGARGRRRAVPGPAAGKPGRGRS